MIPYNIFREVGFKDDEGNYLFIKVCTQKHGKKIEQMLIDYCKAEREPFKFD